MKLGGVILAAGASRRMGSVKALLEVDGERLVDRQIRLLRPHCEALVVVVGIHGEAVRREARLADHVQFVDNPDPDRGMLSSLQCGLAALPVDVAGWLFTPVDLPRVNERTVARLVAGTGLAPFLIPRYQGRRGHPVLVDGALRAEFLAAGADQTPRDLVDRHRDGVVYLDVDDPGVCLDVDTPDEYRAVVH